jgi:hypothetical protein
MRKLAPYQAIYAAQRLGFTVKPENDAYHIEGPGNDGRGIFDNWYASDGAAWRAVVRYVRKHGLQAPPEPPSRAEVREADIARLIEAQPVCPAAYSPEFED